jgi:Fe-S oxidoreductase
MEGQSLVQAYRLFDCIQCGRCTGGCPMSLKSRFNIRRLIYEALIDEDIDLRSKEVLWDCTTCATCTLRCPKGLDPTDMVIGMRSILVDGGRIPPTIRDALKSLAIRGNPLTMAREERADWAEGLGVKEISEGAKVLYFVGCSPSYDPRVQKVAKALVKAFKKANVDFGILGNEEVCCGSEARRVGETGLFEMLREMNLETLKQYPVELIVTTSPHCYNAFKNEYQGLDLKVEHYTQFVVELIEEGRLPFSKEVKRVVTYQDPCFLGKQNKIFEEPRNILRNIPGLELRELDRSRERSLCCEGGGGRMWVEGTNPEERLAHTRVQEAMDLGAEVLATACPFCLLTLEDAAKTVAGEGGIQVMDIMELVGEAL